MISLITSSSVAFEDFVLSGNRDVHLTLIVAFTSQLLDTKSQDKKMTLLHFIVQTVKEKFPEIANFDTELRYIEKAASGKTIVKFLMLCRSLTHE